MMLALFNLFCDEMQNFDIMGLDFSDRINMIYQTRLTCLPIGRFAEANKIFVFLFFYLT